MTVEVVWYVRARSIRGRTENSQGGYLQIGGKVNDIRINSGRVSSRREGTESCDSGKATLVDQDPNWSGIIEVFKCSQAKFIYWAEAKKERPKMLCNSSSSLNGSDEVIF